MKYCGFILLTAKVGLIVWLSVLTYIFKLLFFRIIFVAYFFFFGLCNLIQLWGRYYVDILNQIIIRMNCILSLINNIFTCNCDCRLYRRNIFDYFLNTNFIYTHSKKSILSIFSRFL